MNAQWRRLTCDDNYELRHVPQVKACIKHILLFISEMKVTHDAMKKLKKQKSFRAFIGRKASFSRDEDSP